MKIIKITSANSTNWRVNVQSGENGKRQRLFLKTAEVIEEFVSRDDTEPAAEGIAGAIAPKLIKIEGDRLKDLLGFRPAGDTESTTIGGLVTEWLGHVPRAGETVERGGIRIEVLAGDDLKVEQVRVSKAKPETVPQSGS